MELWSTPEIALLFADDNDKIRAFAIVTYRSHLLSHTAQAIALYSMTLCRGKAELQPTFIEH